MQTKGLYMLSKIFSKKAVRVVLSILCVIWMGFIFHLSAESSEVSQNRSSDVIDRYLDKFSPGYSQKTEAEKEIIIAKNQSVIRSLAHAFIYTVLGFLSTGVLLTYEISMTKRFAAALIFCVLYSISDEIHQIFVPGRAFQFVDLLCDAAGSVLGITSTLLSFSYLAKLSKNKS